MQQPANIDLMQRALRAKICTQCYQRPTGSETLDASTPRSCESTCPIFLNLPKLIGISHGVQSSRLQPYEQAAQRCICSECTLTPSAGEFCIDRLTRTCPLSRYLGEAVAIISEITAKRRMRRVPPA